MCRRKSSAMQSIEVLCASQNLEAGTLTAKAKLLLGSYRRVCWATLGSCTLDTDDRYCVRHEGPEIALEYLRTYSPTEDKALFEAKLKTLFDSRWVMELVDDAMMQVKEFPDMGDQYFEILSKCYLSSMQFNYGYEKKKFDAAWKRLAKTYEEAGMSPEAISMIDMAVSDMARGAFAPASSGSSANIFHAKRIDPVGNCISHEPYWSALARSKNGWQSAVYHRCDQISMIG